MINKRIDKSGISKTLTQVHHFFILLCIRIVWVGWLSRSSRSVWMGLSYHGNCYLILS